ncbi:MAG: hypothetical protein ACO1QS_01055 [Verrucomicrobiota bacterium]
MTGTRLGIWTNRNGILWLADFELGALLLGEVGEAQLGGREPGDREAAANKLAAHPHPRKINA